MAGLIFNREAGKKNSTESWLSWHCNASIYPTHHRIYTAWRGLIFKAAVGPIYIQINKSKQPFAVERRKLLLITSSYPWPSLEAQGSESLQCQICFEGLQLAWPIREARLKDSPKELCCMAALVQLYSFPPLVSTFTNVTAYVSYLNPEVYCHSQWLVKLSCKVKTIPHMWSLSLFLTSTQYIDPEFEYCI